MQETGYAVVLDCGSGSWSGGGSDLVGCRRGDLERAGELGEEGEKEGEGGDSRLRRMSAGPPWRVMLAQRVRVLGPQGPSAPKAGAPQPKHCEPA